MPPRARFSLSGFALAVILTAMAAITAVQGVLTYRQVYDRIQEGFDRKILAISTVTADFIDGDDHRKIMEQKDEASPLYLRYAEPMRRIRKEKNVTFLYTQIPTGGNAIVYGLDGTVGPDHSPVGSADVAPDSEIGGIVSVYQKGVTYLSGLRSWQQWGILESAYVPIFAKDGSIAAMVGTDVDISLIKQRTFGALLAVTGLDLLLLLLAGYIASRVARRMTGPIGRLKHAALQVAAGRYGLQADIRSPTELATLANSFNRLSRSLDHRLHEMRKINETVESQRRDGLLFQSLQRRDLKPGLPAASLRLLQLPSPSACCDGSGWVRWQNQLLLWAGPVERTPLSAARTRHDLALILQPLLHRNAADWPALARALQNLLVDRIDGYLLVDLQNDSCLYLSRRCPPPRLGGIPAAFEPGQLHTLPPDTLLTWCTRAGPDASSAAGGFRPEPADGAANRLDGLVSRWTDSAGISANALALFWQTGRQRRPIEALRERLQRSRLIESHFPGLAPDKIDPLLSIAQMETRAPGDRLAIQGEAADLLYLVIDGSVRIDATEAPLLLSGARWIGEFSVLYGGAANASATAVTPLECLVWDRAPLAALLAEHPALEQEFKAMLARTVKVKLGPAPSSP